jgi:hypothetical protein
LSAVNTFLARRSRVNLTRNAAGKGRSNVHMGVRGAFFYWAARALRRKRSDPVTTKLHIDKRAAEVAALGGGADDDDLLTTIQVAAWLGVSVQFLEIGRSSGGYGPPFTRLAPRAIRYRRGDVLQWLRERTHARTSEYAGEMQRKRKGDAA